MKGWLLRPHPLSDVRSGKPELQCLSQSHISVIEFITPSSVKQIWQFLHLTSYHTAVITQQGMLWTGRTQTGVCVSSLESVDLLKQSIMTVPILSLHDSTQTFLIHTDVCDLSLGVALMQKDADGKEAAAVYGS